MQLQSKALYNLVKFTSYYNPSIDVKKWQIENLRVEKENNLFKRLKGLGLNLDKEIFLKYINEVDSPEELSNLLAGEIDIEVQDQIYLILFELFRRFSSQKCLSIFCDELDHRIFLYDTDGLENDELLQNALANLKNILDSNIDLGISYKKAFENLLGYLAHDLENFLFDYISDVIEAKNKAYAFDLIDGFYPYVNKKLWFDFLKAKLQAFSSVGSSNEIIEKIFLSLKEKPNLDLQLRILKFMVEIGDRNLFLKIVKETSSHLKKEKEFKEILNIAMDFYTRLDKDQIRQTISNLLSKRSKIKEDYNLKETDFDEFFKILS